MKKRLKTLGAVTGKVTVVFTQEDIFEVYPTLTKRINNKDRAAIAEEIEALINRRLEKERAKGKD